MTIEEDIKKDQECIFKSLTYADKLHLAARGLYVISPTHAIGTLLMEANCLITDLGIDMTRDFQKICKKIDKILGEKE